MFSSRVFNVKANRHRLKISTHVLPNDHWLAAARFTFLDIAIWPQRMNHFSAFDGIRAFQSVPQKMYRKFSTAGRAKKRFLDAVKEDRK